MPKDKRPYDDPSRWEYDCGWQETSEEEKKPFTWDDIEKTFEELKKNPIETDNEKLEYFKKKMLGHLDELQKKEEEKKIIPFPKVNKNGK